MQITGLVNKTVLITGSSKGIGRGVAIVTAKAGANVVINHRDTARAADEVREGGRGAWSASHRGPGGRGQGSPISTVFSIPRSRNSVAWTLPCTAPTTVSGSGLWTCRSKSGSAPSTFH